MEASENNIVCTNCNKTYSGNFCSECGEKKFNVHELSLKHFLTETMEGLFHFDNKLFKTVKILIAKPGKISDDYVHGRKIRYVKPFQLFLIVNLIVFLLPVFNPFSLPLQNYISYKPFINYGTVEIVKKEIIAKDINYKIFEPHFNAEMHLSSKAFIMLFIPVYAFLFAILFVNKKRKFTEHLIFATHYLSVLLIGFIFIPLFVSAILLLFGLIKTSGFSQLYDSSIASIFIASIIAYLYFAFRRFYKANFIQTFGAAIFIGFSFFFFLQCYRMFLFYKILYFS